MDKAIKTVKILAFILFLSFIADSVNEGVHATGPDINNDGVVDLLDLVAVSQCIGQPVSDPKCRDADIDKDGDVDQKDLNFVSACYGHNAPPEPTAIDPGSAVTSGQSYTVSWSSVNNALYYLVQESTSPSFSSPVEYTVSASQEGTSKSFTHTISSITTYYYRVLAQNDCGVSSNWSNTIDVVVLSTIQIDIGGQFVDEVKRSIEELTSKTLFGGYADDKIKHLLFLKFGIPDVIPVNANISILLDMDDLAGITKEGQEGWVTYWVDFEFGISEGLNPLPIGAGFIGVKREINMDDPWRTGSVSALVAEVVGKAFSGVTVTEYGIEQNSLLLSSLTSDLSAFTLLSTTWNLQRGEIQRRVLLDLLGMSFQTKGAILSFLPIGRDLFNLMFQFDYRKQITQSGLPSIWRSFTSSDDPVQTGNRLSIINVYGGIDTDSDGRLDNYVPFSAKGNGEPSVYYPLKVDFFSDDLQVKNLKIVVSNVPEGWTIESLTVDGKPPLFNKDTYPVDNAILWTLYRTEWHIGCIPSANKNATVDFTLYESKLFGNVFLDKVSVKFGFPRGKINHGTILLLLSD